MNKEERSETQNIRDNKDETKKRRTIILTKNVNEYDTQARIWLRDIF